MKMTEREAMTEVSRVVENYNESLSAHPEFDGTGYISLTKLPDDPEVCIDWVIQVMMKKKIDVDPQVTSEFGKTLNSYINQVHDAKKLIE